MDKEEEEEAAEAAEMVVKINVMRTNGMIMVLVMAVAAIQTGETVADEIMETVVAALRNV